MTSRPIAVTGPWSLARASGLAAVGSVVLLAASVVLAVDAAAAPSFLVPGGRREFPGWMAGPLVGLGERTTWNGLGALLLAMLAGWLLVLAGARSVPRRALVAVIVAAHVIFLLAPPLLSADVFGYVGFARLGVVHHLDPYVFGTAAAPHDPVRPFLRWHDAQTPYGPLFTLLSYALVPLGIAGALWSFKAIAFAASLGTVALVWRIGERRGLDPRPAAALVGLSPALLVFEVGGGHNDALVVLATVAGIGLVVTGREAGGAAAAVAAAALKVSAGLVVPFAIAGSRRRRAASAGAAGTLALTALGAVAGFGHGAFLGTVPGGVARHSVPGALSRLVGAEGFLAAWRGVAMVAVAGICLHMLWRAAHGADWIACAGWTTLALLVGTTWLLPWYATWLTPLAALADSRRLRVAAALFVVYAAVTRVAFVPT